MTDPTWFPDASPQPDPGEATVDTDHDRHSPAGAEPPTDADRILLSQPLRQSPLGVLFGVVRLLRAVGIVQLGIGVVFVARGGLSGVLFVLVPLAAAVLLALALLSWWRFSFRVEGDELHVTKGVLSEDRLTVPLDRVQSVSIDQQLLHRVLGLVRVSVETAGASEAEFEIDAVTRPVAEALQRVSADHASLRAQAAAAPNTIDPANGVDGPEPTAGGSGLAAPLGGPSVASTGTAHEPVVVFSHSPSRLLRFALASFPSAGLIVLAPLIGFSDDIADLMPVDISLPSLPEEPGAWLVWFIPAAIAAAVLCAVILNVIRAVVTDWDLTLTTTDKGLRRNAGLFSKTSRAAALDRTQLFRTRQNPAQRRLGLIQLDITSIGLQGFRLPACDAAETSAVRDLALGRSQALDKLDRRLSPALVFLEVRNKSLLVVLATGALSAAFGWAGLALLLVIPLVWVLSRRYVHRYRWGFSRTTIGTSSEVVARATREMLWRKVNHVDVSQSFFQRRRGLASITLSAASGNVNIPMISAEDAWALRDFALAQVETDSHAWM